jgi:hypothetical protein
MIETALHPDIDAATYHQRQLGVASKSALDQIARSPLHYRSWIDGVDKQTPAMWFGSLLHSYVLETAKCLDRVAVLPDFGDCRLKMHREARDAWREENANKMHIEVEDWDRCRRMGDAVHKHPIASALLAKAVTEVTAYWVDETTEIQCKARMDGVVDRRFILDLKSTEDASPEGFAKSTANYRYHVQDAFYSDGLAAITGAAPRGFVFIAVEKSEPYAVATYQLDEQARDRGRELYRRDLATLKRCFDSDEWPAYGTSTMALSLPAWAMKGA